MNPKCERSRESAVVTKSRWLAYATTGAASAFGCAKSAEATVHYSGLINHIFTGDSQASFRVGQLSGLDFQHYPHFYGSHTQDGGSAAFDAFGGGASAAGFYATCVYDPEVASVSNLSRGQAISTRPFVPNGGILATREGWTCGGGARGQFLPAGVGFIGFKFNNGSGDQYGWARVKMRGYPQNQFKLIDYAYGDVGDPIKAGQKSSGDAPELESLGGLALGAAGLMAWRRRHSKKSVISST
jgi:hypothetical protein